jgi:hypothetical protein
MAIVRGSLRSCPIFFDSFLSLIGGFIWAIIGAGENLPCSLGELLKVQLEHAWSREKPMSWLHPSGAAKADEAIIAYYNRTGWVR